MDKTNLKVVVITGSTQGIGYGLADAFLDLGCTVTVSGRTTTRVEKAAADLAVKHPAERILGQACDVTEFPQVQALWDAALARFGKIDIWINNAGIANSLMDFWKQSPEEIHSVVDTNMVGVMYGSVVALRGMIAQGFGAMYNMEGLGSDGGRKVKGLALYGSTKAGLHYFNEALMKEVEGTPVLVGALRPGMVATEMLSKQYEGQPQEWERVKRIFNILSDRVETVTPWLAKQILANHKNGVLISWTSGGKMFRRFLTAPFVKRNVFD